MLIAAGVVVLVMVGMTTCRTEEPVVEEVTPPTVIEELEAAAEPEVEEVEVEEVEEES